MAVLESLLATFRQSRAPGGKPRRRAARRSAAVSESLEQRLLLTNIPDYLVQGEGALKTVYLDFDGYQNINAFSLDDQEDGQFSLAELQTIEEVFLRVAEDFIPFGNLEIRAADPEPAEFNNGEGIHVVIGRSDISPSITATQNDFSAGAEPNVVIVDDFWDTGTNAKNAAALDTDLGWDIAYRTSRAVGRALGLDFVGGVPAIRRVDLGSLFASGQRDIWSNTAGQDDFAIFTNAANGLTFAADDHGNSVATATNIPVTGNQETITGVISENTDVDYFTFSTTATTATFSVRGLDLRTKLSEITGQNFGSANQNNPNVTPNAGGNLDPVLELFNANGVSMASDLTAGDLFAGISMDLPAGQYYLAVSNEGTYGSLGQYTLTMDGVDSPFVLGVPPRQSKPGANFTFFLDFNGHVVTNDEIVSQREDMIDRSFYVPVYDTDGDRTSFSQAEQDEMVEIWARVAEDFAPFDVNVSTSDPFVYNNQQGLLVAIGGDGTWLGPVGTAGPSFAVQSTFSTGAGSNNAIAFSDNFNSPKETALEASAVIGLTLGIEPYIDHAGGGTSRVTGDPAVGPIGGDSVSSLRDVFLQGEGLTPGFVQDPLNIINSAANMIPYRADDHGDNFVTASIINVTTADEVLTGIIEENGDADWFSFQTLPADATISITGLDLTVDSAGNPTGITNPGANLDPVLELYRDVDGNGNLVLLASDGNFPPTLNLNDNNPASLKAGFTLSITEGLYYLRVATRSNEYGNLGQYTITIEGVDGTPAVISFVPDAADPAINFISENDGLVAGVGRIDRPFGQPASVPLTVNLVSTDPTELTVPAQVTIPPGQQFVTFDVTAVDDDILDGDQNVVVEAYVNGVLNSSAILKVADHETISAAVTPNPIRENAGPAGATLTVTRSNSDIGQANHWVGSGNSLEERDPTGAVVRTIPVEWPVGVRPLAEIVHDVQVMQDGNIAVYNGTGQAFLSIYNVTTATWRHFAEPGLSANTALDPTIGGITSVGDFVFLTDLESFDGDERGIVRVNTVTGQIDRFADSSVGSRLFILSGASIVEVNAVTGEILNTITPQATIGSFTSLEAIAFDGSVLWALFDTNFGFFGGGGVHELQKLNPDTGEVLEIHSVPLPTSRFFFSDTIGMTTLNDTIYFNLPFDNGFSTQDRAIQAYNPANRQLVGGLFPFEALNNIVAGENIGALKGDGTAANPDVLLVHGYPDTFFGGFFDDRIYLIDPTTGRAIDSFATGTNLSFFFSGAGIDSLDDVIVGTTIRNGLIYLNLNNGIRVFDRTGARVDIDPNTVAFDDVPHAVPTGFDFAELAAGDVPGVTAQELSFRDVTIGVTDSLLYGLVENGTEISVYDPNTLIFSRSIQLDAVVNAIAVDEDGNILGGGPGGTVRIFDDNGNTIAILNTTSLGLANIADVDTNISEEVIVSDINGVVVVGPRSAVFANDASQFITDTASTGTTTFASFGRHSKLPTGAIVVTLTSDDVTELMTPVEVMIPVGQASASVPLDVIDDNELDGPQIVNIAGDAPNYVPDATQVTVLDAETIGVEIRRDSILSVLDANLVADGDRFTLTVNGHTYVFEIEDTFTANGIALSSQYPVYVDFSSAPTPDNVATAIGSAITTADLGVTVAVSGHQVTLTGAPYYPTVALLFGNSNAVHVEKPVAETADLISNGIRVFRSDTEGPFTVPASTGGSVTDPVAIPDDDVTLSRISIVDQVSRVTDVNLTLNLQHSFLPDLDVTLVSPSGTRVALFTDLASNESRMTNTVFDDEAATRIVDGNAPFSGRFIPKQLLSRFDGEDPSGTWTLEVVDDNVTDTGTLLSWSIQIETLGISETQLTLISTDTSEATVILQTVTIPAARSEVFVDLTAIDDTIVDGTIPVTIGVDTTNTGNLFDLGSDVVDVTDVETLTISLDKLVVSEGDGTNAAMGTVTRSDTDMTTALTVVLTSSDNTELDVVSSVVIGVGESSATFPIDAIDDLDFDGDQMVTISATAPGYVPATSEEVTVTDQEPRLVLSTLTPSIPEDAGTITISLSRLDASDLSQPQNVRLVSSDLSELTVPTNFVIGIGSVSTSFTATILEDSDLDGPQTVRITASDPNTTNPSVNSGFLDIVVEDAEFLSVTVPPGQDQFLENAGTAVTTATVSVSSLGHTEPIIVDLTNGDTSEISIPNLVVIPVGETSATFTIDAVNDDFIDRDQLVSVTATSTGYRDGVLNLTVRDHEPPVLVGPEAIVEDPTPTIDWDPVGGATRYDLWVNDVSRGIVQLFRLDNIPASQTEFTPTQELGVGRYRYWVRAYDDLEQPGFWSPGRDFQIRTRPQMISPANRSTSAESSFPEISWTSVVDTARYDLWVNNVTTGESQVIREQNLQTTSYASSLANLPGGTYRAWSRAFAPDNLAGFWSAPVTFTVLAAPQNISPSSATFDRTPQISWDAVEGATNYYVWLTLRNPGQTPVVVLRDQFVTETFRVPETDLADGRYAVWVKAIAADGTESDWSSAVEFTIGGRPEFVAPTDNANTSSTPLFLWTGIDGAQRYEFWMNRTDIPQSQVVYDPNVQLNSFAVQTPLAAGTYRVWVRAISEMGEASFWSAPVNFTVVAAGTPYVAAPVVGAEPEFNENPDDAQIAVTESDGIPGGVAIPAKETQNSSDVAVDEVMAEWAAADRWVEAFSESEQSEDNPLAALGLGILTAGTAIRRTRRRKSNC